MCVKVCTFVRARKRNRGKHRENRGAGQRESSPILLQGGQPPPEGRQSFPGQAGGCGAASPKSLSGLKSQRISIKSFVKD